MRAIILNRYSIINEYRGSRLGRIDQSCFLPGALTALRWLRLAGFNVFVISHQPQISRGQVSRSDVDELHACLRSWIELSGGQINAVRYCTDEGADQPNEQSPHYTMLMDLAHECNLMLASTYFVGDTLHDMRAGRAAGSRIVMVRTGYGADQAAAPEIERCAPEFIAPDLLGAVRWVLRQEGLTLPSVESDTLLRRSLLPTPAIVAV
ncbi:MAG: HAD-IIIA family hydrolase [Chloroflexales bacterium]|nr:HAD-IIIA family hydrolase [Chloroflexales bacterium]